MSILKWFRGMNAYCRAFYSLSELRDDTLRDIGISRSEIHFIANEMKMKTIGA